jgi:hypothetical protein
MHQQRLQQMEAKAVTHTGSPTTTAGEGGTNVTTTTQQKIAPSAGILPGRVSDSTTTTEQSKWGASKTTTVSTSRKSGGFFPGIRGKTTTTQTVTRGPTGQTSVETNTESRGGFFIIPLGPVGLVAAGALAAKHAVDSHNDRQNKPGSSS